MAKTLDAAGVKRLIQEIKGANKNLNTAIPISTENTTESMAQNVKNIADYVEKAKAAGVANVNGMAVTCLIDGENSGVGYLYVTNTQVLICGILAYEDNSVSCISVIDGTYGEQSIVIEGHIDQVTSDMLVEGARKPIIITGDMTEVDEETYQKLSQEGTDVILNLGGGTFVELQGIFNTGDTLILMFGYSQFDESDNGTIGTYTISINTSAPHTLTLAATGACNPVPKSELIPVLQEIDLTGTDAERKAKLDQFETDWKALTGASHLAGARFVGRIDNGGGAQCLLSYNEHSGYYSGISAETVDNETLIKIQVSPNTGSIITTPLFSHLEAITISIDNTPESKAANIAAIEAYEDNLEALGFNTTKGYMIPVTASGRNGFLSTRSGNYPYAGYVASDSSVNEFYNILVLGNGEFYDTKIQSEISYELLTISKKLVPAINEVKALVEKKADKSLNAKSLEAITIKTGNTPEDKAANVAAIKAYVDNLKLLGVDTTLSFQIPIYIYDSNYAGTLVKKKGADRYTGWFNLDNRFYPIVVAADGTYVETQTLTIDGRYSSLTTTSKGIIPAINETFEAAKTAQSDGRKGSYMRILYEAEGAKFNEATGYYELNGLTDITEEQMAQIYNDSMRFPKNSPYIAGCYSQSKARTLFSPITSAIISSKTSLCYETFAFSYNLEYIAMAPDNAGRACSSLVYTFGFLDKLRKIDFPINVTDDQFSNTFKDCKLLEHVLISEFHGGKLSFIDSPRLNYTSLRWLVDKAKNTTAVTVTVHATTYGYLTGMTPPSEQVGGTSEQWTQLMADAAARNISFATA